MVHQGAGGPARLLQHKGLESLNPIRIGIEVGIERHSEHVIERDPPGLIGVQEATPGGVMLLPTEDSLPALRAGYARLEQRADGGQLEPLILPLRQHSIVRQPAHQPVRALRIFAQRRGDLGAAARPLAEFVGQADLSGNIDGLGRGKSIDQVQQLNIRGDSLGGRGATDPIKCGLEVLSHRDGGSFPLADAGQLRGRLNSPAPGGLCTTL